MKNDDILYALTDIREDFLEEAEAGGGGGAF